MVKFFVGKKWGTFRQVTKIITNEKLMPMKIITDNILTVKGKISCEYSRVYNDLYINRLYIISNKIMCKWPHLHIKT